MTELTPFDFLDEGNALRKLAAAGGSSLIKVMGKVLGVNWNTLSDTLIEIAATSWIPVGAINIGSGGNPSFQGNSGLFTGPNGTAPIDNMYGANGVLTMDYGPTGPGVTYSLNPNINSPNHLPISGNLYLNVSVPDGGSPDPVSDIYILGIDLTAL